MKNVNCTNCGQSISQKATVCPSCGHPNKQSKNITFGQTIFGLIFGIIFFGLMKSCVESSMNTQQANVDAKPSPVASTNSTENAPSIEVTASKLYREYQDNEVAADNKYKGKHLEVVGIVSGINKNFLDNVYLTLRTPNEFSEIHADIEDGDSVANLRKGTKIELNCKGGGMIAGSPMLSKCTLTAKWE